MEGNRLPLPGVVPHSGERRPLDRELRVPSLHEHPPRLGLLPEAPSARHAGDLGQPELRSFANGVRLRILFATTPPMALHFLLLCLRHLWTFQGDGS